MMQPRPKSLSVDQDGGQAAVVVHLVHDVSSCASRVTWAARIMRMSPYVSTRMTLLISGKISLVSVTYIVAHHRPSYAIAPRIPIFMYN